MKSQLKPIHPRSLAALRLAPRFGNTLETQRAQIEKLEADLAAATQLASDAAAQITTLTTERDQAIAARDESATTLTASTARVTELTNSLAARDTELAALKLEVTTLKANETTVGKKAAELLASQGHAAPLAIAPDTNGAAGSASAAGQSRTELIKQYNALTDSAAKAAFYAKHKDVLG